MHPKNPTLTAQQGCQGVQAGSPTTAGTEEGVGEKCAAATAPISIPISQMSGATERGVKEGENSEHSSGIVAGLGGCPSSTHSSLGSNFKQICARP